MTEINISSNRLKVISEMKMDELVEALNVCEAAQAKIYATYRRAAEHDLEFRQHSREEHIIRQYMFNKVSGS